MKFPAIFDGSFPDRKPNNTPEIIDNFTWKSLDEKSSKRFGINFPLRPDEIIFCEKGKSWAGKLQYHTLPGHLFSSEILSMNDSVKRKDLENILFKLLEKIIEIMESQNITRLNHVPQILPCPGFLLIWVQKS